MKSRFAPLLVCAVAFLGRPGSAPAQPPAPAAPSGNVSIHIQRRDSGAPFGVLYVKTSAGTRRVADRVAKAWVVETGRAILYTVTHGKGGFESGGQSLVRYDVRSGQTRTLWASDAVLADVIETRTRSGKTALLVKTTDPALGAPGVAIVHPARGVVWQRHYARFLSIADGDVRVAILAKGKPPNDTWSLARPVSISTLDLDQLLTASPPIRRT